LNCNDWDEIVLPTLGQQNEKKHIFFWEYLASLRLFVLKKRENINSHGYAKQFKNKKNTYRLLSPAGDNKLLKLT